MMNLFKNWTETLQNSTVSKIEVIFYINIVIVPIPNVQAQQSAIKKQKEEENEAKQESQKENIPKK